MSLDIATNNNGGAQADRPPTPPMPEKTFKSVCCHNMTTSDLTGTNMELVKVRCNPLFENCSMQGCCDNSAGQRVCACQPNLVFYVLLILACLGLIVAYNPPASASAEDASAPGGRTGPALLGYGSVVLFVGYCLFRTVSPSASHQLDQKCQAIKN